VATVDELLTVLDPIRLDRTVSAVDSIARNVSTLTKAIAGTSKEIEETEKKAASLGNEVSSILDQAEARFGKAGRYVEHVFQSVFNPLEWNRHMDAVLDRAEQRWQKFGRNVRRHMSEARGGLGRAGGGAGLGLSGNRGVFNAAMTQVGRISQALPMGGLLGLALYGVMQESEWTAAGARVARMFAQTGEVAGSTYSEMTNRITKLRLATGFEMEQELAATAGGFAQFGIGAEEALVKSEFSAGALGDTIFDVALGFDFMTKSAAGTTSALVAQAAQITGEFDKSANSVFRFGFSLRDSGANFTQVMSMMMQSLSGLRLQRQGVGELTKNYLQLREGLAILLRCLLELLHSSRRGWVVVMQAVVA
jgi:hypothetical protein